MHSIGHFVLEQNPNMKVLYVTSEEFTNEVIESIRSGNSAAMTKLREKYRTVDVIFMVEHFSNSNLKKAFILIGNII